MESRSAALMIRVGLAVAFTTTAASCVSVRPSAPGVPPRADPGRPGWLLYRVGELSVAAPQTWKASEVDRALTIVEPEERARLEVSVSKEPFRDRKTCLEAGEASLRQGEELLRLRRHPSRLAGMPAIAQEADEGPWHGWAFAACDGGRQYRIFFTAMSTAPHEVLDVYRALFDARLGGS